MCNKIKYSFVVPIYNDGYLVSAFCTEFEKVFKKYLNTSLIENDVELIFVNDGSSDNSFELLKESVESFKFVKVINLSRNFGQHIAILCGYKNSSGVIVGRLNADMQDPPYEIPKLLKYLGSNADADMIVGLQERRKNRFIDILTSKMFFWLFNWLIGSSFPSNTSTLRVMNRKYVNSLLEAKDKTPFLQGLEHWVGFNVKYIKTEHRQRCDSKSSYNFSKRVKLAFNAAVSFSDRPLKLTVLTGFLSCLISLISFVYLVTSKLLWPDVQPGYTSTICILLFFFGIQITVTGLCGIYIGKILLHVQNRPLYYIKSKINFE